MAKVPIRYYRTRGPGRNGFWEPGAQAEQYGLPKSAPCGPDGPAAWAIAEAWNEKLKAAKVKAPAPPKYPPGSLGSFYLQFQQTKAHIVTRKKRTKEDYERVWPEIERRFGTKLVTQITASDSEDFHVDIHPAHNPESLFSWNEAHRTLKVWRKLLHAMAAYEVRPGVAPIGEVSNPAPKGREATWTNSEIQTLIDKAIEMNFAGVAISVRFMWDAMLSPVDARLLPASGLKRSDGAFVSWRRTKTSKRLAAYLSHETDEALTKYQADLVARGINAMPDAPIVRRPDGRAYLDKDSFGDDFRLVRAAAFPGDDRQMLDIRRSAATEARQGGATRDDLGRAMANSLDDNDALYETYVLSASRSVHAARLKARNG
jgi:hypothetical protein